MKRIQKKSLIVSDKDCVQAFLSIFGWPMFLLDWLIYSSQDCFSLRYLGKISKTPVRSLYSGKPRKNTKNKLDAFEQKSSGHKEFHVRHNSIWIPAEDSSSKMLIGIWSFLTTPAERRRWPWVTPAKSPLHAPSARTIGSQRAGAPDGSAFRFSSAAPTRQPLAHPPSPSRFQAPPTHMPPPSHSVRYVFLQMVFQVLENDVVCHIEETTELCIDGFHFERVNPYSASIYRDYNQISSSCKAINSFHFVFWVCWQQIRQPR